jgi:hypothetical protein
VVGQLRPRAFLQLQRSPLLDVECLNRSLVRAPAKKGFAIDSTGVNEIKSIPDEAKQELLDLIQRMGRKLMIPDNQMVKLIALISKPDGSDRPVGLVGFVIELFLRMRAPALKAWGSATHDEGNYCRQQWSAAQGSCVSELEIEMDALLNRFAAGRFLDLRKYFGQISLHRLIQDGLDRDCPFPLLLLGVESYASPRLLEKDSRPQAYPDWKWSISWLRASDFRGQVVPAGAIARSYGATHRPSSPTVCR